MDPFSKESSKWVPYVQTNTIITKLVDVANYLQKLCGGAVVDYLGHNVRLVVVFGQPMFLSFEQKKLYFKHNPSITRSEYVLLDNKAFQGTKIKK